MKRRVPPTPPRYSPKQLSEIAARFMDMPGLTIARGGGTNPGYGYIPGNAYWSKEDSRLHLNREWYGDLARVAPGNKKGALSLAILAHELGHIGQPPGLPNGRGGLDVTPQYHLDMENQADAFARQNLARLAALFFQNPAKRKTVVRQSLNQFNRWRKAHPYTLDDF